MGRSSGYRARKYCEDEVGQLRERLATLRGGEWMKAKLIMQSITLLLGHSGGPCGGNIAPRACRYCDYYGHTKQHCKRRIDDEQKELEQEHRKHQRWEAGRKRLGNEAWDTWLDWADRRWDVVCSLAGCEVVANEGPVESAEELASVLALECGACDGCAELERTLRDWEATDPEPVRTSDSGA